VCLGGGALRFEALQSVEVAVEGALGGVHAALDVDEFVAGVAVDVTERGGRVEVWRGTQFVLGESHFEDAEAAHQDDVEHDGVDYVALFGGGGLVAVEVFLLEHVHGGGIFAGKDDGFGVDAGFHGIAARTGFALGGAWARGLLRVEVVGLGLLFSCHMLDLFGE